MANSLADGNIRINSLPDEIRTAFRGTIKYQAPDNTEKWLYKKTLVTGADALVLFADGENFLGATETDDLDSSDDKVKYIMIRHTGYTDIIESIKTKTYAVLFNFTNDDPEYNAASTKAELFIYLEPNDTIALKLPNCVCDDLSVRVAIIGTNGPSANGDANTKVLLEVAAIIDDVT